MRGVLTGLLMLIIGSVPVSAEAQTYLPSATEKLVTLVPVIQDGDTIGTDVALRITQDLDRNGGYTIVPYSNPGVRFRISYETQLAGTLGTVIAINIEVMQPALAPGGVRMSPVYVMGGIFPCAPDEIDVCSSTIGRVITSTLDSVNQASGYSAK